MEPTEGSPEVTLFQPVEDDGGTKYLTDYDTAEEQLNIFYGEELCTAVNTPEGNEVPSRAWRDLPDSKTIHFLFEGKWAGKGKLIFEFRKQGDVLATMPPVYLDLRDAEEMYETWTVGDVPFGGVHDGYFPSSSASKTTGGDLPAPQSEEERDYFLFVHGWNMSSFDKKAFADTAFKRLWHQGFKGRFGAFRWPTFFAPWTGGNPLVHFDESELRAWKSGVPLAVLLSQLGGEFEVRVYAHSMGNVVASEAIRSSSAGTPAHTYISAQAALSAHVWDSTTADMTFVKQTPDVYAHYWEAGATSEPHDWESEGRPSYMDPQYMPSGVRYINHYNPHDWALSFIRWQVNQQLKPNNGYHYGVPSPNPNPDQRFWKNSGILGMGYTDLTFPADRFEIFSFGAESHSFATGQEGATGGVFGASVDLNGAPFNFGAAHKGHSAQFRSTIQKRWKYWEKVLADMQIATP